MIEVEVLVAAGRLCNPWTQRPIRSSSCPPVSTVVNSDKAIDPALFDPPLQSRRDRSWCKRARKRSWKSYDAVVEGRDYRLSMVADSPLLRSRTVGEKRCWSDYEESAMMACREGDPWSEHGY